MTAGERSAADSQAEGTVEILAENIEKAPEAGDAVRAAIKEAGPEAESLVRSVVGPIKTKIKTLGKSTIN